MKKIILIALIISACISSNVFAQNTTISFTGEEYSRNGNTFSSASSSRTKSQDEKTIYTWKDSKGNEYPIYISSSGSCYVFKVSNKTGKEYKSYMKPDISRQICSELGREYKGKTNTKKR